MDAKEFGEWIAFHNIEPFDDDWRQTGMIAAATQNIWRTKGKPLEPEDFMPIKKQHREVDAAQQHARFKVNMTKKK